MKKKYAVMALLLVCAMVLTGCSWKDVKEKFTGTTASGGSVEVEDYDPSECVELAEYKGIEIDCSVSDSEIQQDLDTLVDSNAKTKKIKNRKAKKGDTVNINYKGTIDGKAFDGGSADNSDLTLGSGQMIPGFEDGIIGMKPGEKKDVKVTFPEDYQSKEVAGKKAVFAIKLNYISKEIKEKLTDAFVKKHSEYKTIDEYKEGTRKKLVQEKKSSAFNEALNQITEKSKFNKIPETLVASCVAQLKSMNEIQLKQSYNMDLKTYLQQVGMTQEQYDEQVKQSAEGQAKTQLIIEAIAKKEGIEPSDDELKKFTSDCASQAGIAVEDYKNQFSQYYGTEVSFDEYVYESYLYEKVNKIISDNLKYKE